MKFDRFKPLAPQIPNWTQPEDIDQVFSTLSEIAVRIDKLNSELTSLTQHLGGLQLQAERTRIMSIHHNSE